MGAVFEALSIKLNAIKKEKEVTPTPVVAPSSTAASDVSSFRDRVRAVAGAAAAGAVGQSATPAPAGRSANRTVAAAVAAAANAAEAAAVGQPTTPEANAFRERLRAVADAAAGGRSANGTVAAAVAAALPEIKEKFIPPPLLSDIEELRKKKDSARETIIKDAEKKIDPSFERELQNFINDEPIILFNSEYIVDNKFVGVLVVWEDYRNASHYEVFKRNVFDSEPEFERVLFLDKQSLANERKYFEEYIINVLGFDALSFENIYVFFDDVVKQDRIYEYKIAASTVPSKASEIDYDLLLERSGFLPEQFIDRSSNLISVALTYLGDARLAWLISLVNETIPYFGATSSGASGPIELVRFGVGSSGTIPIPNNIVLIEKIILESISLFGVKNTIKHLLEVLGGASSVFIDSFVDAIDEVKNVFSPKLFGDALQKKIPAFKLLLNLASSFSLDVQKIIPVSLPVESGNISITSVANLTVAFDFLNRTIISIQYSQNPDRLSALRLLEEASKTTGTRDGVNLYVIALKEAREKILQLKLPDVLVAGYLRPEPPPPEQVGHTQARKEAVTNSGFGARVDNVQISAVQRFSSHEQAIKALSSLNSGEVL